MKKIKKLAALMMAAIMVLAMSMTAFAAEAVDPDYKMTIKTVNGHTYKIYQLATGDVSSDKDKLSNIEVGKAAKTTTTVKDIEGLVGKTGETLGDAAWALINQDAAEGVTLVTGDGSSQEITLPGGYYVIEDTFTPGAVIADGDTLSRFMVMLIADRTVTPKTTSVTPDKKIVEGTLELENSEASIGDTITYKLSGTLPDMTGYKSMKFVFVDTMDKGLTPQLKKDDELTGTVGTDTNAKFKVTAVDKQENGTTIIRIALVNAFSYKGTQPAGAAVTVNISAILNENAEVVSKDNENKLKIDFNNRPEYEGEPGDDFEPEEPRGTTAEIKVQTYTTKLTIKKVDKANKSPLKGAEFKLEGKTVNVGYVTGQKYVPYAEAPEGYTGETWYKLADGAYTTTAPTSDTANKYESTENTYALVDVNEETYEGAQVDAQAFVDENGVVTFTGLGKGEYTLTEVTTPDGYNTLAPITFTVDWTKDAGFTVTMGENTPDGIVIGVNDGLLSSEVPNAKGSLLPSTGGIGTTIFYVVGAILVIGAGVILVAKKRMSREV